MTSNSWKYKYNHCIKKLATLQIKYQTHKYTHICLDSELSSMTRPYIRPDIDMHSSDQM